MTRQDEANLFAELSAVGPLSAYGRDLLREIGIPERCVARIAARFEQRPAILHSAEELYDRIERRYGALRRRGVGIEDARKVLIAEGFKPKFVRRYIIKGRPKYSRKSHRKDSPDFGGVRTTDAD
ncbi:MAG: hypothetical protein Q8M24_15595 [Pseudolabrys sp.]|nr:hypothetical protein [Pseudolabrys sp.]MDP2296867.1 hypothetical protein [Pseudolabrys sp.]